jgi:hypothetical protein
LEALEALVAYQAFPEEPVVRPPLEASLACRVEQEVLLALEALVAYRVVQVVLLRVA